MREPAARLAAQLGVGERLGSASQGEMPGPRELLLVTLALALAIGLVLHKQLIDWYGVPDPGDPLFSMWRMGWVAHQILADPTHLFDANMFYPERGTLTYSDSMLLPALTSAPLVWMGVPLAVAYTILLLSAFLLSGVAMYFLARALSLSPGASWVSALIFALCQYRFEHYSHLELQMTHWMPMTLLAALRLLSTGRGRYFAYLMLAAGAQWYSSMYYGVFLTIYAGVFVAVLALVWRPGWGRFAAATAALICGVALALPLARVYRSTEGDRGIRNTHAVAHYSARPVDYLQPNVRSIYRDWNLATKVSERELFPNVTPVVLAAVGAWPPVGATRLALLVSGLVAFDGSLGFNGTWYRLAYENLNPLRSMRVPARFAILVNLTLALLAGFGAARLLARARNLNRRRIVLAALTAVFVVESLPHLKLQPVWKRPPFLYSSLGPESGAVLFEFPIQLEMFENFAYIYFSTWHWTKMVNGYSGFLPRSYWELEVSTDGFPLGDSVPYLQKRGVTHVALHCAFWTDEACALAIRRLGADRRLRLVTSTWWEGKTAQLYELSP
jgi:hypothetical protein